MGSRPRQGIGTEKHNGAGVLADNEKMDCGEKHGHVSKTAQS